MGSFIAEFLVKPYSRYGPGGEPYLHENSDGEGGFDPTKDWKSYKIPIQFSEAPEFSDYKAGIPASVTHLGDVASLSFNPPISLTGQKRGQANNQNRLFDAGFG